MPFGKSPGRVQVRPPGGIGVPGGEHRCAPGRVKEGWQNEAALGSNGRFGIKKGIGAAVLRGRRQLVSVQWQAVRDSRVCPIGNFEQAPCAKSLFEFCI